MRRVSSLALALSLLLCPPVFAQERVAQPPSKNLPNIFASQFYVRPADRSDDVTEVKGLLFKHQPNRDLNSEYSIITDFAPGVVKTQAVADTASLNDLQKIVTEGLETSTFEGVEIRKLTFPVPGGKKRTLYWVGNKAYDDLTQAQSQIVMVQTIVQQQGGNFAQMVKKAQAAFVAPETEPAVEVKSPEQFAREERLMLKFLDQLDIGNEMFGPLQGVASGEPIVWQSFGESSWRLTNLEIPRYDSQVGFWTNRLVFKGIRAPLNTVDPYLEVTTAMDSTGVDFKNTINTF